MNERALGIELLTQEIQKKGEIQIFGENLEEKKILKFERKNEILSLLLNISQLDQLIESKREKIGFGRFDKIGKKKLNLKKINFLT